MGRQAIRALLSLAALTLAWAPASAQETDEPQDPPRTLEEFPDPGEANSPFDGLKEVPLEERSRRGRRGSMPPSPSLPEGGASSSSTEAPSVLAVLAHPDDELVIAPVLARIIRSGGSVTLVFATSGDAGPGVSEMEPGAALASIREDEARCAAFALGVAEPRFWHMGDGTLAVMARAPDSAMRDMKVRVTDLIEHLDPKVVMTWGPDGGYGHSDHRAVSVAVTEVIQAMGEGRPDLLYPAFPADENSPQELSAWAKTHPSLVTDRLRYEEPDLDAMRIAAQCYESQFTAEARTALPELLHGAVWRGNVFFRLAFPGS